MTDADRGQGGHDPGERSQRRRGLGRDLGPGERCRHASVIRRDRRHRLVAEIRGYAGAVTGEDPTPPRLRVRTTEIDDPGPLLALLPARDAYAWLRRGDGVIGFGEVTRHKPASIAEADEWWSDLVGDTETVTELDHAPSGAGLLAFGSFVFDPENTPGRSRG